jgi:dephospho-CoA kinase
MSLSAATAPSETHAIIVSKDRDPAYTPDVPALRSGGGLKSASTIITVWADVSVMFQQIFGRARALDADRPTY